MRQAWIAIALILLLAGMLYAGLSATGGSLSFVPGGPNARRVYAARIVPPPPGGRPGHLFHLGPVQVYTPY